MSTWILECRAGVGSRRLVDRGESWWGLVPAVCADFLGLSWRFHRHCSTRLNLGLWFNTTCSRSGSSTRRLDSLSINLATLSSSIVTRLWGRPAHPAPRPHGISQSCLAVCRNARCRARQRRRQLVVAHWLALSKHRGAMPALLGGFGGRMPLCSRWEGRRAGSDCASLASTTTPCKWARWIGILLLPLLMLK